MKKPCTRCLIVYPAVSKNFTKKPGGKCGLNSICKECEKLYRQKNKENRRESVKRHRNKSDSKKKRLEYDRKNREKINAQARSRIQRYKEKRRAYYEANKDRFREWNKEWRKKNREKIKIRDMKRRAKKYASGGSFSVEDFQVCLLQHKIKANQYYCHWCKRAMSRNEITLDHVMPLTLGGIHTKENIVIACRSCNCSKGKKHPDIWRKEILKRLT